MAPSAKRVLKTLVAVYEQSGQPLAKGDLADRLNVPFAALDQPLATLQALEAVRACDDGYRPTITGTQLLDRGIPLDAVFVADCREQADERE
jgi:predicted transcriptional regulator